MQLVTNLQMKAIEQKAIKAGVPSLLLMENAAMAMTNLIIKDGFKKILLLCGKGNNGGDGLACGRQLFARGIFVKIIFVGKPENATPDCLTNLNAAKALNIPIKYIEDDCLIDFGDCDLIVDALVGTGLSSALREPLSSIVKKTNNAGKPVYAMDCPTGISTDTGENFENAVYATKTVTFHFPKIGLTLFPACEHTGELVVGNISLPQNEELPLRLFDNDNAKQCMPKRQKWSDKSTYGKVFAFVGCDNMTGAAILSLKSAYKVGAGLVYAFTTDHCRNIIQQKVPEVVASIAENNNGYIANCTNVDLKGAKVVLMGCGLGNNPTTYGFLKDILEKIATPLVLDADGLNIIASHPELMVKLPKKTVLTPHPKEMSRLTGLSVAEICKKPLEVALDFSKSHGVITVLKNTHTIIATPEGKATVSTSGCSAMSKGGSGDCLAGIISGLIAQGVTPYDAACLGCYINGKAGEIAAQRLTEYGVCASDMIERIPYAIEQFMK